MNIPKFRAWDKETEKVLRVHAIFFDEGGSILDLLCIMESEYLVRRDIKQVELMQSTGLKDKNGVEIFEGDIVEVNDYGNIIIADIKHGEYDYSADDEYECHRYGWYINHVWKGYVRNTGYCLNAYKGGCEVVGNIYENPELLEGVKQ